MSFNSNIAVAMTLIPITSLLRVILSTTLYNYSSTQNINSLTFTKTPATATTDTGDAAKAKETAKETDQTGADRFRR